MDATKSGAPAFCSICLVMREGHEVVRLLNCTHTPCLDCMTSNFDILVKHGGRLEMECPECFEHLHPTDVKKVVGSSKIPTLRWCPAADCTYAVIGSNKCTTCPMIECQRPQCKTQFCYNCRQIWHPDTECHPTKIDYPTDEVKPCPKCRALINKTGDGSCNEMHCGVCDFEFCWLCLQETNSLHYITPSGCTLFGKKKWSKAEIALSRIAVMIGGPIGIAIASVVAIPAITFGAPIIAAKQIRKMFAKKKAKKVHTNLAVTGGVALTAVVSPVIAALAVGVSVPVLLGFVYGVVPFAGFAGFNRNGMFEESVDMQVQKFSDDTENMINIFEELNPKDLYTLDRKHSI